ncbi:MAG: hypothetical protein KME19_05060 [Microcoleus vaginatus WJT46-NPBG5]|nr:hypothetical protein [Microcoleus vaginatus WJT46-NPBG5]
MTSTITSAELILFNVPVKSDGVGNSALWWNSTTCPPWAKFWLILAL